MGDQEIRAALERHWSDINNQDVVHEIYHDDVVLEFPQGGERLVGVANVRAMREVYPSSLTMTIQRIRGSGDLWVAENVITYDGKPSQSACWSFEAARSHTRPSTWGTLGSHRRGARNGSS